MRLLCLIGICAVIFGAVSLTVFAQAGAGTVQGVLVNNGTPNANARISIAYYAPGPIESIVYSDANGNFSCGGIPVGKTVSVVVYDSGKHVVGKGTTIINSAGQTVTVTIEAVPVVVQN